MCKSLAIVCVRGLSFYLCSDETRTIVPAQTIELINIQLLQIFTIELPVPVGEVLSVSLVNKMNHVCCCLLYTALVSHSTFPLRLPPLLLTLMSCGQYGSCLEGFWRPGF